MNTLKNLTIKAANIEAKVWIKEEKNKLITNFKWKLQLHLQRYKRIEMEIKNVRTEEIKIHKERMESHITVIKIDMSIIFYLHPISYRT